MMATELLIAGSEDEARHYVDASARTMPDDLDLVLVTRPEDLVRYPPGTRVRFVGHYWTSPAYDLRTMRARGLRLH
jgi:hypothetical protein